MLVAEAAGTVRRRFSGVFRTGSKEPKQGAKAEIQQSPRRSPSGAACWRFSWSRGAGRPAFLVGLLARSGAARPSTGRPCRVRSARGARLTRSCLA